MMRISVHLFSALLLVISSVAVSSVTAQTLIVGDTTADNTTNFTSGFNQFSTVVVGSNTTSSNNLLTVVNTNTRLRISGTPSIITVGLSGSGNSMVISNGGRVEYITSGFGISNSIIIGSNTSSSNNSVLVTGTGSSLQGWASLYVGLSGSGNSMVISNGGRVFGAGSGGIAVIGGSTNSSNNTVLVTGQGSLWTNSANSIHFVGESGSGNSMVISNGGTYSHTNGTLTIGGNTNSSNNSVLVTGSNSTLLSTLHIGRSGSDNSLVISNGGRVSGRSLGTAVIGRETNSSNNSVLVTGTGSLWSNGFTWVGERGSGNSMVISNGGTVISQGTIGRETNSSNNSVLVTGTGSLWSNGVSAFIFGNNGSGNSMVISSGARVTSIGGQIGEQLNSSNNSVTVTGDGSLWSSGSINVGESGSGNSMVISSGAMVTSDGFFGDRIGNLLNSSNNSVTVTGSNSLWSNSGTLGVGYSGRGNSLTISNGGTVRNATGIIGSETTGSNNSVTVTGSNSLWSNSGTLTVGSGGSGNSLTISNGGTVRNATGIIGSATTGSNNSVTVTGSNSLWSNSGTLTVGSSGSGNILTISNGGTVRNAAGVIGSAAVSSNNSVLVSGTGSTWSNSESLRVGVSGSGTLTVANGGSVVAASGITIAASNNSTGTLNIGRFGTNDAAGTTVAPTITFGNGIGTINFNQRDASAIAAAISGNGSVNQLGAGTTILSGNNSYTGNTLVSAGALQLNGTNSGSGAITVSGGTFGGTGRATNSAVSMSGGAITPGDGSWAGTLSIGSLSITGGMLNILLGGNSTSLLAVNGNATLGGTLNFSTNAVLAGSTYTFLTFTGSLSGTFTTTNALPTGYQLVYGSNSVYLQALTGLGPITTTFGEGTNAIITGGSTNFLVVVTNTAAAGSANMVFTATNGSNTTGSIGSTTLTPQSGTNVGGLTFTGTNVGLNQTGTFTVSSTNDSPSSGAGTVTVNVYDHASGSLADTTINLSNAIVGFNTAIATNLAVTNAAGFRVDLKTISTNANTNLTITDVTALVQNTTAYLGFTLSTNQGVGAFTNLVTVVSADDSPLSGATTNATNTVTVTGAVYDHASNILSTNSIALRAVHVGYTNAQTNWIGMSNASGFRVAMKTAETNSSNNLILSGVSGVSNGVSSNAILTFGTGLDAGAFTNVIEVVYGDDSTLAGASSRVGTNILTVSGLVYTGQSVWTTNSGNWTNFANWSALGGTPGLDGSLSTNDTATFGSGSGGIVTLNTNAALNALSFSNASAYTVAGTGTISLVQGSNAPSISTALGSHTISNALSFDANVTVNNAFSTMLSLAGSITGAGGLTKTEAGTAIVSGNNSYSGSTSLNAGRLVAASTNALGSGPVSLTGGTLALSTNLTISSLIWGSNSVISLTPGTQQLTINGAFTSGGGGVFDFGGFTNNLTNTLITFGTNSGFNVSNFSARDNANWNFILNGNSLQAWYGVDFIIARPNNTIVSNTVAHRGVIFETNGILTVTTGAHLTITTPIDATNNGTVVVNGVLSTPAMILPDGGTLMGSGRIIGDLRVQGGTVSPGNSPGTLTVNGNYSASSGTLAIEAGSPSNYDRLVVSGSASLGGTLNLIPYDGYVMQFGDNYTFLTASGGISGSFSATNTPSGIRARLLKTQTTLSALIAPASYTQLAANRNQSNVATALNSFIPYTSGDQLVVSTSLDSLTASQYNQAFNAIMPTFYQQIATIAFNNANAQNMQLVQRLWGLRVAEGGGFSMSGLADNMPLLEGQGDGKGVLDSKKDILRPGLDNHWGMFVDGNGIFAQANSGNMLPGYNSQSGGVTTGLTYKWNENVGTGIYCGYQGTYTKSGADGSGLGTGSRLIDNAVRFGVFGTYGQKDGKGLFVNALAGGGYHNFQATRVIQYAGMNRTANSAPGAGELDTMLAAGYDIKKGKFTFGPTASLQYTYLGVNSLNETGAQSLSFNSGGWNSSSMLSSVGAHAAYSWVASKNILVVPQVNLSLQHEFMQNPYAISGNLGGTSPTFSNWSATPIRDFLYTGVGFTVEFAKRWNTSFFYNPAAGNSDLVSQNIFWSAGVKF